MQSERVVECRSCGKPFAVSGERTGPVIDRGDAICPRCGTRNVGSVARAWINRRTRFQKWVLLIMIVALWAFLELGDLWRIVFR